MSAATVRIRLEPLGIDIDVPHGTPLTEVLSAQDFEFPCGGLGTCAGCGVRASAGSLPVTAEDRAAFSSEELAHGWRLACQAQATSPLVLECGQWHMEVLADDSVMHGAGKRGLGIAIDLGTTTIAAQMIDLLSGDVLAVETRLNPQSTSGSDVMSRIQAAISGVNLTDTIRDTLGEVVKQLSGGRVDEIAEIVLVGNTVMHHLFSGLDVEPLAHVPFVSPRLGEQHFSPEVLRWPLSAQCSIRFLRCIGGFVGSDILAGIVATGMTEREDLIALIDLGTNGEIAIGNQYGVVCASTAAGPAFEAGTIQMGMRAAAGAIAHVSLAGRTLHASVIGHTEPRGICGSGLVDAVAAGLADAAILPSGRIADGSKVFPVADPVVLYQSDIRELQLAKAAIASGFRLLLRRIGAEAHNLKRIHLAGAFGNYLQAESAIRIGLIEAPQERIEPAGNTALRGAKHLLLATQEPALPRIEHVSLASDPQFQDEFARCMTFPPFQNAVTTVVMHDPC
jgi:uncharacterized 2Fe-2S/4Fe-4S cluster protein (DUF4445 family)